MNEYIYFFRSASQTFINGGIPKLIFSYPDEIIQLNKTINTNCSFYSITGHEGPEGGWL
jgi:hypothetical protein